MDQNYKEFTERFKLLSQKNPTIITNTLSNIFTMRLIGNKTHGDLAEVGISEFINQFMYDYKSIHVGKDRYRAKTHEEDIVITSELTKKDIPISLKAYGDGPLQLSTDKESRLFNFLETQGITDIQDDSIIKNIFLANDFSEFGRINVFPLIYREEKKQCNIMIFDFDKAITKTHRIIRVAENKRFDKTAGIINASGRAHPIFMFLDKDNNYICEVRYGGKAANALQRGLWTHTQKAVNYFNQLTGWIDYSHNETLVKLFRLALNATEAVHQQVNVQLQNDINTLKTSVCP